MPRAKEDSAEAFLAAYPPAVAQLVLATRARPGRGVRADGPPGAGPSSLGSSG